MKLWIEKEKTFNNIGIILQCFFKYPNLIYDISISDFCDPINLRRS